VSQISWLIGKAEKPVISEESRKIIFIIQLVRGIRFIPLTYIRDNLRVQFFTKNNSILTTSESPIKLSNTTRDL